MKKKGNIICMIAVVVVLLLFGVFKYYEGLEEQESDDRFAMLRKQYAEELKAEEEENQKKEEHYQEIREDIPGIVCWGDDMTYGKGGVEKSYPDVLEAVLTKNEYELPVYNMGISGESTLTVLGRQGGIPYVVNEFTLKDVSDLIEVEITSAYKGREVDPLLRKKNPGVNPCSISGIEGTLYGYVLPAELDKVDTFYFERAENGDNTDIPKGTEVITAGLEYRDYINIISIGESGGWENNEELIEQYQSFVDSLEGSKNQDSYLILGMSKGTKEEYADLEEAMTEEFGEHYVNIREYLSTDAMKDLELEPTENDNAMMAEGKVPESLMFDESNLNDDAYEAIGRLVYNKLVQLNYIKK